MTQRRIYQEEYPYFVTFRTAEGWPMFEDEEMAGLISRVIFKTCGMKRYDVLSYQIMTDHVHLLTNQKRTAPSAGCGGRIGNIPRAQPAVVARSSKEFTISDLMHGVKSYFCNIIGNEYGIIYPVFQKRFYTRIVSTSQYLYTVILYIKQNPIKAELLEKYHKMPYQYFNWPAIRRLF